MSGQALFSALVIADVFACDQNDQIPIGSSYRFGVFAHPERRAVLADLADFPLVLLPGGLHAQFEVLPGGVSSGKNTFSTDWPTSSLTL